MYKLFLLISIIVVASCKVAKKQQVNNTGVVTTSANNNTLLWKVTGNNMANPSYIYGTMHLLCAKDAVLSSNVQQILNEVDKIYFELDMDDLAMMMGAFTKMNMKGDTTLKMLVSEKEYTKIKSFFAKAGAMLPFSMLEKMQPLLTSSTIAEQEMGCDDGVSGIEMRMMEYNKKGKKKEVLGLETITDQLNAFGAISYKEQAAMLVKYLDSIAATKMQTQQLVNAYKSQNLDTIANLMLKSEPELMQYADVLLVNRNKNWVKQFKNIFAKQTIIAAVGAGHLVGEEGVLQLLCKEGYTVSPVDNK